MTTQSQTISVADTRLNTFMAQVYLLMTAGMIVTAVVSSGVASNLRLLIRINQNPWLAFGLLIVQMVLVVALSAAALKMKPVVAALVFLLYAALTGVTLSTIFLVYSDEQIASVFWITAGTFFVTSLIGLVTKRDMSRGGGVLFMLLAGWTVAWLFSLLIPAGNFNWFLNFVGVALFAALTAWDANRVKAIGQQIDQHPARGGLVVIGALSLYLDFINLFLLILRASNRR